MRKFVMTVVFVLGFAYMAMAASFTINIPVGPMVQRYVDAFSLGMGYVDAVNNADPSIETPDLLDDATGLDQIDYAKSKIRYVLKRHRIAYEDREALANQRSSSQNEADDMSVD